MTMANISRITDHLFTGGDLPLHLGSDAMLLHLQEMQDAGITHILDNRMEWSDEAFVASHAPDVHYLHNGQDDAGQRMPDSWFDRGVSFALAASHIPGSAVLAHCHMGINRGPSMAYAILLSQGWAPDVALDAIRAARPIAAIGYAIDALDWWHCSSRATPLQVARDRAAVRAWFEEHPLDVVRIIRGIRETERPSSYEQSA
jgi:dual specificity phosphatase 3